MVLSRTYTHILFNVVIVPSKKSSIITRHLGLRLGLGLGTITVRIRIRVRVVLPVVDANNVGLDHTTLKLLLSGLASP